MAEKPGTEPKVVAVAGDVTIDWNLGRIPVAPDPNVPGKRGTAAMSYEPGGAALLGKLIAEVARVIQKPNGASIDVRTVGHPQRPWPGDGASNHSYAVWSLHDRETRKDGPKVWRISEQLGIEDIGLVTTEDWTRVAADPPVADLVVLDAGLGANQRREQWPRALTSAGASPWVLMKMARPVGEGELSRHVVTHHADRLVAVVRANDLRTTEAQISRELSWEQSAQDLLWELTYNPEVKQLSRCAYLIVSFGTSGAMLLSNPQGGRRTATLFFDPPVMEEEWVERYPGGIVGYTICLTAAVAGELLVAPDAPQIDRAIRRGLDAMRELHLHGFDVGDEEMPRVKFPVERIAEAVTREEPNFTFAQATVRQPAMSAEPETRPWTILEEVGGGLEQVARKTVLEGPDGIVSQVPVASFGRLLTVDRTEIEGYRSVRSLIAQYARERRPERPLSIAVFGRPGSGKSFGIREIAKSLDPDRIESLTFNLSQFQDPGQLLDAFHQVRDLSLKGKLPLVFWDEFDATLGGQKLGLLRHFLAPMQDGEFQEEQVTHHIGAAIFVFAGGTKQTMVEFSAQFEDPVPEELAGSKGRDFVSRLKGYVDLAGPNPLGSPEDDPHYVIRRAILLRNMLKSKKNLFIERGKTKELQIDGGVLRAFLRVEQYVHGARSMESVIAMSLLAGKNRFERSCLPSAEQLQIHVSPDFLKIVRGLVIEGRMLLDLSEAAHVVYCANMLADGYTWGGPPEYLKDHEMLQPFVGYKSDPTKVAKNLVPYEELEPGEKEQNEDFARDIPSKVQSIGYEIVLGRPDQTGDAFPNDVVEQLSEQEHDRWMRLRLQRDWSWGSERDDKRRLHPAVLPWEQLTDEERDRRYGAEWASRIGTAVLPERDKNKDRAMIRAVTKILADNGYRVRKRA